MNGGVIGGGMAPAHLRTRPTRADHGAGWHIHQIAMAGFWADILNALRRDAAREIPAGEKPRHASGKRLIRARPFGMEASQDGGVFYLAGQMRGRRGSVFSGNHDHARAIGKRHAGR